MTTPVRTPRQVRDWFALQGWRTRMLMSGKLTAGGGACCSNPNPQPYDDGTGNGSIRCMNCGA